MWKDENKQKEATIGPFQKFASKFSGKNKVVFLCRARHSKFKLIDATLLACLRL